MPAVRASDVLLRVSPKMLERYNALAVLGAGRGRVAPVPFVATRADATTCATYIDRDGMVRLAAANVPRVEWVDLDGDGIRETPGLLLEGARTNAFTRSEEFDHADWAKTNLTVTANQVTAPDGTVTGDALVVNNGTFSANVNRAAPTLTNNVRQPFAVFARSGPKTWFHVQTLDKFGTSRTSWFNLIGQGVLGTINGGHVVRVFPVANGWFRIEVSFDAAAGGGTPGVACGPTNGDNDINCTGTGSEQSCYVWGAQFETDKVFPSSYIKTVAAAVTRAADSFTVPFGFGPVDMTVLARLARPVHADAVGTLGVFPGIFDIGNETGAYWRSGYGSTSRLVIGSVVSGSNQEATTSIPGGAEQVYAFQFKDAVTGPRAAVDVGSGYTAFSSAASLMTAFGSQTLRIGKAIGSELYGVLMDLIIARGLFTRAEMLVVP